MEFVYSLISYLALMLVIVLAGALGVFIGINLRKKSNAKVAYEQADVTETEAGAEV